MTDFIFMVRDTSYMFVTGPDVVKTVTNETVTSEELGGAKVHTSKSSEADGSYENDVEMLLQTRRLIDFLPLNNQSGVPELPSFDDPLKVDDSLDTLIPDNPNKPYDIKELILKVVDEGDFFEIQGISPRTSSPVSAASRGARWASSPTSRWCSPACSTPMPPARRPVSSASATPSRSPSSPRGRAGFLPGTAQEYGGLIKHGAKLLFAYSQATVPLVTVITRKAFGGAYDVMASKHVGGDVNYAWPTAQIAVMGAKGAWRSSSAPTWATRKRSRRRRRITSSGFLSPFVAAERGYNRRSDHAPFHPQASRPRARHAALQEGGTAAPQARQPAFVRGSHARACPGIHAAPQGRRLKDSRGCRVKPGHDS